MDVIYEIRVVIHLDLHPNVLVPRGYCFRRKHLSCCIEGNKEEIILIYDYMKNKSLITLSTVSIYMVRKYYDYYRISINHPPKKMIHISHWLFIL